MCRVQITILITNVETCNQHNYYGHGDLHATHTCVLFMWHGNIYDQGRVLQLLTQIHMEKLTGVSPLCICSGLSIGLDILGFYFCLLFYSIMLDNYAYYAFEVNQLFSKQAETFLVHIQNISFSVVLLFFSETSLGPLSLAYYQQPVLFHQECGRHIVISCSTKCPPYMHHQMHYETCSPRLYMRML